jgi:RNA polymerase primary sigma factor
MVNDILDRSAEKSSPTRAPANLEEQIEKILSTLAPREEMILRMQFSLTCERIRQIELKALRKVRGSARSLIFQSFIRHIQH